VLLAVLVFLSAKEMFGTWSGFIALALLAFDLLAHGAVVGMDTGLACFLFASIDAFYRYVKAPSAGGWWLPRWQRDWRFQQFHGRPVRLLLLPGSWCLDFCTAAR